MASIMVKASLQVQQALVVVLFFEFLTILNFANGFSVKLLRMSNIFVLWEIEVMPMLVL